MPMEVKRDRHLACGVIDLRKAVKSNDIEVVREILSKVKKLTKRDIFMDIKLLLLEVGHRASDKILELLVDHCNFKDIDDLGKKLVVAVIKGDLRGVKFLMKNGAKLVKDDGIAFPSRYIFNRKNIKVREEMIKLLIEHGYDTQCVKRSTTDIFNQFCVYSLEKDDTDAVEIAKILFKSGVPFDGADNAGFSPLLMSILCQHLKLTEFLVNMGADVNVKHTGGLFPLYMVTTFNRKDFVDSIIRNGAEVNAKTNNGFTALHRACEKNYKEIINLLVRKGADVSSQTDDGNTPLSILLSHNDEGTVDKSCRAIIREISKLSFKKAAVPEKDLGIIRENTCLRIYFQKCKAELSRLSKTKFYDSYTYLSVLNSSKKIQKLANLTKNEEFVKTFNENVHKFPYYKSTLKRIMNEAVQTRDTSIIIDSKLKSIFGDVFPDVVLRNLAKNLTVDDF